MSSAEVSWWRPRITPLVQVPIPTDISGRGTGEAALQYIRLGRSFVLPATHGIHRSLELEAESIRAVRRVPMKCFGYSLSHKRGST